MLKVVEHALDTDLESAVRASIAARSWRSGEAGDERPIWGLLEAARSPRLCDYVAITYLGSF
jgi:hypothetical protein